MASSTVDRGRDFYDLPWKVETDGDGLAVTIGTLTASLFGPERDRFAEAVATAGMAGLSAHIVTDLNAHRRHGCPTCLHVLDDAQRRP